MVVNLPASLADDELEWDEEDDEWYNNQKLPEVLNLTTHFACVLFNIFHLSRYERNTFQLWKSEQVIGGGVADDNQ